MNINKCKYYNDSQTSCTLMIDDLVPASVTYDGVIGPNNDWGYLMDKENSLYSYFKSLILQKFPEVRGTIFLPLSSQNYLDEQTGYNNYFNEVDSPEFIEFLNRIGKHFDFAFHGFKHTYRNLNGKVVHECEDLSIKEVEFIAEETKQFLSRTGLNFEGGKFPGYKYNDVALSLLEKLNAKWWALDVDMINRICSKNNVYFDPKTGVLCIPTNLSGDIFKLELKKDNKIKHSIKRIAKGKFYKKPFDLIEYMYRNGIPITIQEHFQNATTKGSRQKPNIYDDIDSLEKIYSLLRGSNVWHATANELAHYSDSYLNTKIITKKNAFQIEYFGKWKKPLLSLKCDSPVLFNKQTRKKINGVFKGGYFVYNNIKIGDYTRCQ